MTKDATTKGTSSKDVGAVVNAIQILRHLAHADGPQGVAAIARATGISPSSAFNILRTLSNERLTSFDDAGKTYQLGLGLSELAVGIRRTQLCRPDPARAGATKPCPPHPHRPVASHRRCAHPRHRPCRTARRPRQRRRRHAPAGTGRRRRALHCRPARTAGGRTAPPTDPRALGKSAELRALPGRSDRGRRARLGYRPGTPLPRREHGRQRHHRPRRTTALRHLRDRHQRPAPARRPGTDRHQPAGYRALREPRAISPGRGTEGKS